MFWRFFHLNNIKVATKIKAIPATPPKTPPATVLAGGVLEEDPASPLAVEVDEGEAPDEPPPMAPSALLEVAVPELDSITVIEEAPNWPRVVVKDELYKTVPDELGR